MKLEEIPAPDNEPYPRFARAFYKLYQPETIEFLIRVADKTINSIDELFEPESPSTKTKMTQVLRLEIIAKFCQYAETLAAYCAAFDLTFETEQEEWTRTYDTIAKYRVRECKDFYQDLGKRNIGAIARILGYPPFDLQQRDTRVALQKSSVKAIKWMSKFGQMYLKLSEIYNAYKHSYRVLLGRVNEKGEDVFLYFGKGAKQKQLTMNKADFEDLISQAYYCRVAIEVIKHNHKERLAFERSEEASQHIHLRLFVGDIAPGYQLLHSETRFLKRGERAARDREEALLIYERYKTKLEKNHKGKYVAIDLRAGNILAYHFDIQVSMDRVARSGLDARICIRRIGNDDRVNFDEY